MSKSPVFVSAFNALIALAVGLAGGALFYVLHSPLPWTLGSLFASAVMTLLGGKWFLPPIAWNLARPFVGVLAGSAFTLPVVMSIMGWVDVMAVLFFFSLIVTLLGWLFFTKVCKYDDVTAFFSSAPGGLGELTLLGGSLGGSVRTLVLIHAVRIIIVVFSVPFLVQFFLAPGGDLSGAPSHAVAAPSLLDWALMAGCAVVGFFIGRPFTSLGGVMVVPMILSAGVHIAGLTAVAPPYWIVALGQVVIGSISGSRFKGTTWRELRTTAVHAFVWAVFLLIAAVAAAWLCTLFADEPFLALLLAFAPGGIVEITIVAYAIGVHVAFVVTCQLMRVILVLIVTPGLFRLVRKRLPLPDDDPKVQ
jgi:membrane AbrB-like protein